MLKKGLTLVGLVAVLLMAGSVVSWAAQGQQGVTLDPGQTVTDDATRQALIAEALPVIIQAGYETKEFDFAKAVADPQGKGIFMPIKLTEEKQQQLREFKQNQLRIFLIGLLYIRQSFEFQGKTYPKGLQPAMLENSSVSASKLSAAGAAGPAAVPTLAAQPSAGDSGGGGGPIVIGPPSPNPNPPPGGDGGKGEACAFLEGLAGGLSLGSPAGAAGVLLAAILVGCLG